MNHELRHNDEPFALLTRTEEGWFVDILGKDGWLCFPGLRDAKDYAHAELNLLCRALKRGRPAPTWHRST